MPVLLAIETSTPRCSVALRIGAAPPLLLELDAGPKASAEVLPMVRTLLDQAGLRLADCDAIAFGAGPGAFTGLRVACGMAQGLAYGADLPVIAVDTLASCVVRAARAAPAITRWLVANDARMDECYWAEYVRDGIEWKRSGAVRVDPPEAVRAGASAFGLAGSAAAVFGARLDVRRDALVVIDDCAPRADAVAELAASQFARGELLRADEAAPVYVRDKVAFTTAERHARAAAS